MEYLAKGKGLIVMSMHTTSIDFKELEQQGKTVIYKESETVLTNTDWKLWGKKITDSEDVFVYRKIVTFEEAEEYELQNELLD